jgi:hypothetical protein
MASAAPHDAQKAEPLGIDLPQRGQVTKLIEEAAADGDWLAPGFCDAVSFFR